MTAYLDRIDSDVSGVFSPSTSASMKASWTDFARGRPAASVSFVLPTPSSLSFLTVCCTRLWSEEAIVASSPPVPHGAHRDRWAAFSNGIWSADDTEIVATASTIAVEPRHNFASDSCRCA